MRGRSRSRSQSRNNNNNARSRSQSRNRNQQTGSIIDRLGVRSTRGGGSRMRRGGAHNVVQQQQRGRSRSRSRVRLNRNNFNNRNNNNFNNNQSQIRRSNSVNARLGNGGPTQIRRRRFASNNRNQNTQLNKPIGGRIVKRTPKTNTGARIQRNVRKTGPALGVNPRRGKIFKRWIKIS